VDGLPIDYDLPRDEIERFVAGFIAAVPSAWVASPAKWNAFLAGLAPGTLQWR
jgi:hypothetical protein